MHGTIEELRTLAEAYVAETILDDRSLAIKRHMADCDECYSLFCAQYLFQKTMMESALIPKEESADEEQVENDIIMQIARIKDAVSGTKLMLSVKSAFEEDAKWNFMHMPYMAAARGGGEADLYQSSISKESRIRYLDGRIVVELDEDVYQGNGLSLLLEDGEERKIVPFDYDEDTGMYQAVIDLDGYSEDAVVSIIA